MHRQTSCYVKRGRARKIWAYQRNLRYLLVAHLLISEAKIHWRKPDDWRTTEVQSILKLPIIFINYKLKHYLMLPRILNINLFSSSSISSLRNSISAYLTEKRMGQIMNRFLKEESFEEIEVAFCFGKLWICVTWEGMPQAPTLCVGNVWTLILVFVFWNREIHCLYTEYVL